MTLKYVATLIYLLSFTTTYSQEFNTKKFSFSGYNVKIVYSTTFKIERGNIPCSIDNQDGVLSFTIDDQIGEVPKDTINIYTDKLEYLYLHNSKIAIENNFPVDTIEVYSASSSGDISIRAEKLIISAGAGSHIVVSGGTETLEADAMGASVIEASQLKSNRANITAVGNSSVVVNAEKISIIKKENSAISNRVQE